MTRVLLVTLLFTTQVFAAQKALYKPATPLKGETHFKSLVQLTDGGDNAEAYWSFDGKSLSFQHAGRGFMDISGKENKCDQIYTIKADGSEVVPQSDGNGRTTCSYYTPDNARVIFATTSLASKECPPPPDMKQGYVWAIYPTYKMVTTTPDGKDTRLLEDNPPVAYSAEATVCKDGSVVFTSDRDGDLELYTAKYDSKTMKLKNIKRVTHDLGYDGGAFFSFDCKKLVWRASRPKPGKETEEYKKLLKDHLVRPVEMELFVGNADGSNAKQITNLGVASFAPSFTPKGDKIIFASNYGEKGGRIFSLYLIGIDGKGLERVTFSNTFESFPLFSPDGKYLAFSSNRNNTKPHETNLFIAEWKD